jgi:RNA polymerase sigma factor (sigma-70 family)
MTSPDELARLLSEQRPFLLGLVRREASGLLGYEEADDLVQGITARALGAADGFAWQGEEAFKGWLVTLTRRHVADRHDHWRALKRGSGRVVRLTFGGSDPAGVTPPAASGPGPSTFASRREMLVLATRALAALSERDRQLVRWSSEGLSPAEMAARLDTSPDTARKASARALDRLRKTARLLSQGPPT